MRSMAQIFAIIVHKKKKILVKIISAGWEWIEQRGMIML